MKIVFLEIPHLVFNLYYVNILLGFVKFDETNKEEKQNIYIL